MPTAHEGHRVSTRRATKRSRTAPQRENYGQLNALSMTFRGWLFWMSGEVFQMRNDGSKESRKYLTHNELRAVTLSGSRTLWNQGDVQILHPRMSP